jgi:hypothetical protein
VEKVKVNEPEIAALVAASASVQWSSLLIPATLYSMPLIEPLVPSPHTLSGITRFEQLLKPPNGLPILT